MNKMISTQIVVFPKDFYLEDPMALYSKLIQGAFISSSKSKPIPIPPDVQRNIPRMIIEWETKPYQVTISFDRIDFQCGKEVPLETVVTDAKLFFDLLQEAHPSMRYKRAGFIVAYEETDQTKVDILLRNLLGDHLLGNASDFNLSVTYNKKEDYFGSIQTNQVINVQTAQLEDKANLKLTILIDFNTHQSFAGEWTNVELHQFLQHGGERVGMSHIENLIIS